MAKLPIPPGLGCPYWARWS